MKIAVQVAVGWLSGLAVALEWGNGEVVLCAVAIVAVQGVWLARSGDNQGLRLMWSRKWLMMVVCVAVVACGITYGAIIESGNTSQLPDSGRLHAYGTIVSPVKVDGDKVRFQFRVAGKVKGELESQSATIEMREHESEITKSIKEELVSNEKMRSGTVELPVEKVAVTIKVANLEEQGEAANLRQGERLLLDGELSLPPKAGNFGQFDYANYLYRHHIHRLLRVEGFAGVERTSASLSINQLLGWLDGYRASLSACIANLFPIEQAGFMSGMLIGVRDDISESLYSQFSRLGLSHIIAISGLHVGVVVGGWFFLLRLCRITRETALLSALFLIPPYILLSGAAPPVIRAGLTAMLGIVALRRGWMKDALQLLAITAIILTLCNPYLLYDIGFQLSYLVTTGLIVFTPIVRKLLPAAPKLIYDALAVTLVAQIVSFPLTVYYFNQFSLLSFIANFTLVPLFSFVALPVGYIALIASHVHPAIGVWIAKPAIWCNSLCFQIIEKLNAFSPFHLIWATPSVWMIPFFYAILLTIGWGIHLYTIRDRDLFPHLRRKGAIGLSAGIATLLIMLIALYNLPDWRPGGAVFFINIGQGDSILVRSPAGRTIVIDGGGTIRFHKPEDAWKLGNDPYEVGKDLLVPLLKNRGVRAIDFLIASHADMDHIGGLMAVIEEIPVKRLLFNGTLKESEHARQLFEAAIARNIPLYAVSAGKTIIVDAHTTMEFLYPDESGTIVFEQDQNAACAVVLMRMYESRFLFTGDMEALAEQHIVERLRDRDDDHSKSDRSHYDRDDGIGDILAGGIDVLKVAHHGSKTSTSDLWLDYWRPKMAVISVGANNVYRHPSPVVTDRLEDRGIPIMRTDVHGETQMKVTNNGVKYRSKFAR